MSSMQQLSRGKHNKIRWVLSNYAQNLCCNLRGGVNPYERPYTEKIVLLHTDVLFSQARTHSQTR